MILRRQTQEKLRAIVRFALAKPDKIASRLKDEKRLKIARWLSKEQLTAILELDLQEIEDLADSDFVAYIESGGRLSASGPGKTATISEKASAQSNETKASSKKNSGKHSTKKSAATKKHER
jgi:hypothetical protein